MSVTIINIQATTDTRRAYLTGDVVDDGGAGVNVTYAVDVSLLKPDATPKTLAVVRQELIAAFRAERRRIRKLDEPLTVLAGVPSTIVIED